MPGLRHDPGKGANYAAGRNAMQFTVHHDTGGSNSYQICKDGRPGYTTGLCQILLPKVGAPWQFVPIDAVSYHCGSSADYDRDGDADDYNRTGSGLEVERRQSEALTEDQVRWLREIGRWLDAEWGIPNVQYRGPFGDADDFRGHVNHRDLHPNPDGLSEEEWDQIVAPAPPAAAPKGTPEMRLVAYGATWLQFGVDTAGDLIQSTYDASLNLVAGAQDVKVLGGNRPSSDVAVEVLPDQRILVGTESTEGKNRAINYRPGLGWYDARGTKLP